MTPNPEPKPSKKFEDALRKVLKTPKSEVDKRVKEDNEKRAQEHPIPQMGSGGPSHVSGGGDC